MILFLIIILISFNQLNSLPTHSITKLFNDNPLIRFSDQELLKISSQFIDQQRNYTNEMKKSKFKNFIQIEQTDDKRSNHLNKFLTDKINQYLDEINTMIIPDFSQFYEQYFKIVRAKSTINDDNLTRIGETYCNLELVALSKEDKSSSVCPWHYLNVERVDMFPFSRANAKCNCLNCQAKTIYDSDFFRISKCMPIYSLKPALIRESLIDGVEKWWFCLEEVSTSCVCSVNLNILH